MANRASSSNYQLANRPSSSDYQSANGGVGGLMGQLTGQVQVTTSQLTVEWWANGAANGASLSGCATDQHFGRL